MGAVLFLALAILMVAFTQEVYFTQTNMNVEDTERIQENILITSAYIDSENHLVLNVLNRGAVTANLVRLWVINQTDNTHLQFNFTEPQGNPENWEALFPTDMQVYSYNQTFLEPGSSVSYNITTLYSNFHSPESIELPLGQNYAIRVVTERGNIASYNLVPAVHARINILASSSNLIGNNVTVVLCITNNDTSGNNIYNVVPQMTVTPAPSLELLEGPLPSSIDLLPQGSTAYFIYVYKVTGSGFTIHLNGTFTRAPQGNYATTTIYATTIDTSVDFSTMPLFYLDAFGSIPALLDSSSGVYTYWGIALVNPYNHPITVYTVGAITTTAPLFELGTLEGVYPALGWSASGSSIYSGVFWESTAAGSPIVIEPQSAFNFTFRILVSHPAGGIIETPVNVEAITTEGRFIKSFTTSSLGTYPSMNLYLTDTPSTPTGIKRYALLDILPSSTQTFNIVAYNSGANPLASRVNLLIRVPVGWTNVAASSQAGWNMASQIINQQADGSWLITIESADTTLPAGNALVYSFSANMPAVTSTTLYLLSVTAYYPQFSPSITSANCGVAIQVKPV